MRRPVKIDSESVHKTPVTKLVVFCSYGIAVRASIKRKYRKNKRQSGPVTFQEFVRFLIDPQTRQPFADRHWRPFHQLCQPCRVHFDFIGHYETMALDSQYVLRRLGIHEDQFPHEKVLFNSSNHVAEMLSQLTQREIRRLIEVYHLDFEIFGYSADISQF